VSVDPFAWFKDVLSRISDHPISRLAELLPHKAGGSGGVHDPIVPPAGVLPSRCNWPSAGGRIDPGLLAKSDPGRR
jgi:hypothetical protein